MKRKYPKEEKYAAQKAWNKRNKEKVNASWRKLRSKNLERFKMYNLKTRLKHFYKISFEEYNEIKNKYKGKCPIYDRPANHIDHDHKTNKVRGILCQSCNHGLGMFRDNPTYLANAIKYLSS